MEKQGSTGHPSYIATLFNISKLMSNCAIRLGIHTQQVHK